jgi:hypothetical protein
VAPPRQWSQVLSVRAEGHKRHGRNTRRKDDPKRPAYARLQPRNREGRLLLGGAVCAIAVPDSGLFAVPGCRVLHGRLPLAEMAVFFKGATGPPLRSVMALVILLFPDRRLTRRWAWCCGRTWSLLVRSRSA